MKKIIIALLALFSIFISTNIGANNSDNIAEHMEISDYYGYLSLLIDTHMEIGRGGSDYSSMFSMIGSLNNLKYYSELDVIGYLGHSFDIRKSFDLLLSRIQTTLDYGEVAITNLKKNLDFLKIQKTDCDSMKVVSDKNFSLALKDLDAMSMEEYYNKSIEYDRCSTESRIAYNAQNKILEEFNYYYTILEYRYNYYYSNKFEIVENYPNILYNLKK